MSVSDNFNATGLPILNEPVTFRVAMIDYWNTPDFNDKQMVRDWTEMTNVAFDWIHMSGQDAQTKVPLMYSTNDLPDAFIGIRQAVSDDYGAQGLNIALGESVPDTLDGFVELLRAFRDGDPNGNGEADEIPFSVRWADGVSGIRAWFHPFGTTSAFMGPMFIRDDVVQATTLQPGYRDAIKWLHSLWAQGLLDQEAFTYEIQAYRAKNQEGVIGVSSAWGGWNIVPEGSAAQAKEWWTPIPPLAGPDGSRDAEYNALAGINSYIQSKEAEWVVNGKIDEEWDDYVKRLNDMGIERVLEIYQTGADRWAGN